MFTFIEQVLFTYTEVSCKLIIPKTNAKLVRQHLPSLSCKMIYQMTSTTVVLLIVLNS